MPSAYSVSIADHQKVIKLKPRRLQLVARKALQIEGVAKATISVALVENKEMHRLNREFLEHDYPTDVLSFLLDEEPPAAGKKSRAKKMSRGSGKSLEGEVIISTEYARGEALRHHWETESEVLLYLVHGLLHLCGYDDRSAADQHEIRAREVAILSEFDLVPQYEPQVKSAGRKKLPIAK